MKINADKFFGAMVLSMLCILVFGIFYLIASGIIYGETDIQACFSTFVLLTGIFYWKID